MSTKKGGLKMIDMMSKVKDEFPDIYTKQGKIRKREPKKYKCDCGHSFSRLKTVGDFGGIKFGSPICPGCGNKAKDNLSHNVWKRAINGQFEEEDFILNTVKEHGLITKEDLQEILSNKFGNNTNALGTLVYFGYLNVDAKKRDDLGIIEYSINPKKSLESRYELIR